MWSTEGFFDHAFLRFKDWLWKPAVEKAIDDFNLYDFDVVHFESGMDFLKNEFLCKVSKKGKENCMPLSWRGFKSKGCHAEN